ncbi:MAG: type I restriction-modification system subunit M [Acidobacteriota bacterium]|nr:type I restriction-modification system subunit M [Acidobacteriota bacterium]
MTRTKKTEPLTTTQQLGSLIKSARDLMRKDKGLSGDLDRLPMLTWVMFLKFLDDMERLNQEEAIVAAHPYRPLLEAPYRWRDWAANPDGTTGDELIAFINQERAKRPDGDEGLGLFAYLRRLQSENGEDRRDVVANVFRGVVNRMINGYLLRDVVNKINGIHFTSSEEIHTLGHLYESMLREMRDSAGDSGEFYTPRPVVKFMVTVTDPKLGETILDPACGTGGFLTETYEHLAQQRHTVEDRSILQERSIYGQEAKPLPYLLAQMNLLLHGMDYPRISYGNSLAQRITEIGDRERVDVILTNPPFGGEEEQGIKNNFPADMQTSETALLFLQLIMRKLRRRPKPGRAAVVVPNGVLFGDGIATRIKEELLREFNLHTIVRLPNGVFAPYTPIPTNVLFFDRSGGTTHVWYYEQPLPEGRKSYSKTAPMQFNEFTPCIEWWNSREENDRAWRVPVDELFKSACNLDRRNPRGRENVAHLPPEQLMDTILQRQTQIAALLAAMKAELESQGEQVTRTPS